MRWLTYRHDGVERAGILDAEGTVRGLTPGIAMLDLLRSPGGMSAGAAQAMTTPDHVAAAADVTLCAPLQPPLDPGLPRRSTASRSARDAGTASTGTSPT